MSLSLVCAVVGATRCAKNKLVVNGLLLKLLFVLRVIVTKIVEAPGLAVVGVMCLLSNMSMKRMHLCGHHD